MSKSKEAGKPKRKYTRKAKPADAIIENMKAARLIAHVPNEPANVTPLVEPEKTKRRYIQNIVVIDHGVKCPHCGNKYDHEKKQKYPNNMQRYICKKCRMPFIRKTEE